MTALREAFIIGAVMCIIAAVCSVLRGKKYVNGQKAEAKKRISDGAVSIGKSFYDKRFYPKTVFSIVGCLCHRLKIS